MEALFPAEEVRKSSMVGAPIHPRVDHPLRKVEESLRLSVGSLGLFLWLFPLFSGLCFLACKLRFRLFLRPFPAHKLLLLLA